MLGEWYLPDSLVSTIKFVGVSVMVWGCFSWFGLRPEGLVNGNMKSEVYVNILENIHTTMLLFIK